MTTTTSKSIYIIDILTFINSLTINFKDVEVYMESNTPYGNFQSNKYYLNLNGELAPLDEPIKTYVPDVEDEVIINKENIDDYPIFKDELLKFGKTFNTIVQQYPKQSLYLRGILNPIPEDIAKNKPDGAILYYNKDLIFENELTFIKDLEDFIINYFKRYNIKGYNVDKFYLPMLLANLYNVLPLYIMALRLKKVLSFEASGYDIDRYFMSYNYLDNDTLKFLDTKSKIWLYGELGKLKTNIGSNATLQNVIKYVYGANSVGVGSTNIYKTNQELDLDKFKDITKPYVNNNFILTNTKENDQYIFDRSNYTLKDITDLETNLNLINEDDKSKILNNLQIDIENINKDRSKTKVFMFDKDEVRFFYNKSMLTLVYNNLVPLLNSQKFIIDRYFINPTDGIRYRLNKRSLFYIIVKCMGLTLGVEADKTFINSFNYTHVFNSNFKIDDILYKVNHKDIISKFRDPINDLIKAKLNIKNATTFKRYMDSLREVLVNMWYIISNNNDIALTADLKVLYEAMFTYGKIDIDNSKSLTDLIIQDLGKDIPIDRSQAFNTITILIKEVFDIEVDEVAMIKDNYRRYIKFINSFKSYTVQFIHEDDFEHMINIFHSTNTIGQKHTIVGGIGNGCFKRWVEDKLIFKAKTTPFKDDKLSASDIDEFKVTAPKLTTISINNDSVIDYNSNPIILVHRNYYTETYRTKVKLSRVNDINIRSNDKDVIKITKYNNNLQILEEPGITEHPNDVVIIKYID